MFIQRTIMITVPFNSVTGRLRTICSRFACKSPFNTAHMPLTNTLREPLSPQKHATHVDVQGARNPRVNVSQFPAQPGLPAVPTSHQDMCHNLAPGEMPLICMGGASDHMQASRHYVC